MSCTCEACLWESERADEAFDAVAEADPLLNPYHREATDAEWWDWLLTESGL